MPKTKPKTKTKTKTKTTTTKATIYDVKFLRYDEFVGEKVLLNFASLINSEENYTGNAKLLSSNAMCALFSGSGGRFFTLYYDECINKKASTFDEELGERLEIFKLHNRKAKD